MVCPGSPWEHGDCPLLTAQQGRGEVTVRGILTHCLEHGSDPDGCFCAEQIHSLQFWLCLPRAKGNYLTQAV